ncbi:MAG: hypothetical protein GX605_02195, partial [Chloroflexi bacterium]|nr:hypothetical protein [Chloroflexota bacterium]
QAVQARSESVPWSEIQGILARGDRRLSQALLALQTNTPAGWRAALETAGIDPAPALAGRPDGALPWAHIVSGITDLGGPSCSG